jgi:diaminohydroxyphosphoribosylaminopyrimidine deaminase/5-amino-6-(5-phosphoribosylamino)uracil reductase
MQRAIELAYLGLGKVSPNPMVGCVIVRKGKIIGEGWHQEYGGPHAEVNAVNSVEDNNNIKGSDVYVTLEPCAHQGKTPPCADMLVDSGVKNIYISRLDVNPLVGGKGIQKLKEGSVKVFLNICEKEGAALNKRFFTYFQKKRPYIILKWAQTADHFIARKNFDSKWISNVYSRQLVHKWRAEEDAILVGANTAMYDNPKLNVRDWPSHARKPLRLVIDPNLKVNPGHAVYDGSQKTIIYNRQKSESWKNVHRVKIDGQDLLKNIMSDLYQREIQSVIIEGGAYLLNACISSGLWDEARIFTSEISFGEGIRAPELLHAEFLEKRKIFNDEIYLFKNMNG